MLFSTEWKVRTRTVTVILLPILTNMWEKGGGGRGVVLFLKWEAAEHSEVNETGWELKSSSLAFSDPLSNGMLRAPGEPPPHHIPPPSPTSRKHLQATSPGYGYSNKLCSCVHEIPTKCLLKLAYCRKTGSEDKAARGSCWNKPFFPFLYRSGGEKKCVSDINCIQCQDILLRLLNLHYSTWKDPILRNKVYEVPSENLNFDIKTLKCLFLTTNCWEIVATVIQKCSLQPSSGERLGRTQRENDPVSSEELPAV